MRCLQAEYAVQVIKQHSIFHDPSESVAYAKKVITVADIKHGDCELFNLQALKWAVDCP